MTTEHFERPEAINQQLSASASITAEDNLTLSQLLKRTNDVPAGALPSVTVDFGKLASQCPPPEQTLPIPHVAPESGKGSGSGDANQHTIKVPPGVSIEDFIKAMEPTRIRSNGGGNHGAGGGYGDGGRSGGGRVPREHTIDLDSKPPIRPDGTGETNPRPNWRPGGPLQPSERPNKVESNPRPIWRPDSDVNQKPDVPSQLQKHLEQLLKAQPFLTDQLMENVGDTAKQELDQKADQIAKLIGDKGDFYSGKKREMVQAAFDEAAKLGPAHVKYLLEQVNSRLKQTNPDLQLKGMVNAESTSYVKDAGNKDIVYAPFQVKEQKATITLVNSKTGTVEDQIVSKPSVLPKGYIKLGK